MMVDESSNSTGSKWLICAPLTTLSRHKTAKPLVLDHLNNMVERRRAHFLLIHKWDVPDFPKRNGTDGHWTTGTCWQRMEEMTESVWRVAEQIHVLCRVWSVRDRLPWIVEVIFLWWIHVCEFICWIKAKLKQSNTTVLQQILHEGRNVPFLLKVF